MFFFFLSFFLIIMQNGETFKLTGIFKKKQRKIYTQFYILAQIYIIAEQVRNETRNGKCMPISP